MSYDPFNLSEPSMDKRIGTHFLCPNGLWLFCDYNDKFLNEICLCDCSRKYHLEALSICLNSKCLSVLPCGGFVSKEEMSKRPPSIKTTKKTKKVLPKQKAVEPDDEDLKRYVQQLARI